MAELKAYLPAPDGTWKLFREIKLMNDGEKSEFLKQYDVPTKTALEALRETLRGVVTMFEDAISRVDAKKETGGNMEVFYAIDTNENDSGQADRLHYGREMVSIPKGHEAGVSETPWLDGDANFKKHVIVHRKFPFRDDLKKFVAEINKSMQKKPGPVSGQALLYIHGFNVNREKAIRNAAQLSTDLKFHGGGGIVIAYIWPSKGSFWYYDDDAEVIKTSANYLHQFITTILSKEVKFSKVHMLAHSMGNRALIKAMTSYYKAPPPREETIPETSSTFEAGVGKVEDLRKLVNIISAAADVTHDEFDVMLRAASGTLNVEDLPGFTIYSSATDRALTASTIYNKQMRLGDTDSHLKHTPKMDSVDVVDASGLTYNMDFFLHSYYVKAHIVLFDIQTLLTTLYRADDRCKRHQEIHTVTHKDSKFFAFEPGEWEKETLFRHVKAKCFVCMGVLP
ncbi:hypothetical protein CY35_07G024500 [Sphagnum magellanicum]|uniref:Uncharacterized protein n=1 Tax=Sphagnum magellanicum TaxID=128215 RepID=A0ACB8HKU9_9BRYO|nr:hypothetical protein CY35_07G024500 [Sphagnum magellanicum]